MSGAEMWCRLCNWSGRPAIEIVAGRPVDVCPNCEFAAGIRPASEMPKGGHSVGRAQAEPRS